MKKKLLYLMLFLVLTVGGFFISPEQILADDVFPTSIKVEDIKKYQASVTNDSGNDIFLDVLKDVSEWNFGGGKLYIPLKGTGGACVEGHCMMLNGQTAITYKVDSTNNEYTAVFSTLFGKNSPNSQVCSPTSWSSDEVENRAIAAGIGQIIFEATEKGKYKSFAYFENPKNNRVVSASPNETVSTLDRYYYGELSINRFLFARTKNPLHLQSGNLDYANYIPEKEDGILESDFLNVAIIKYEQLAAPSLKLLYNNSISGELGLTYSEGARIWQSNEERMVFEETSLEAVDYFAYGLDAKIPVLNNLITVEITDSDGKEYNDYAYVVPLPKADGKMGFQLAICDNNTNSYCKKLGENFTNLPNGTYNVKVTVDGGRTYYEAKNYDCGANFQSITPSILEEHDTNEKVTLTGTFTVNDETIPPKSGTITIRKVDSDTEEYLIGAKVRVKQVDGDFDQEYTISNKNGVVASGLDLGEYEITETVAPDGYKLTTKKYSVKITRNSLINIVDIENAHEIAKIKITKVDADSNPLKGAKLQVVKASNKEVIHIWNTSDENPIELELRQPGEYYVEELEAPEGYSLNKNKLKFEVTNEYKDLDLKFKNDAQVKVPDTSANTPLLLVVVGIISAVLGVWLVMHNGKQNAASGI